MTIYRNHRGFTLIELMISMTLGLLVIGIASQIYLTSYKVSTLQQSAGEIQVSSIFGIQQIETHLRLANLGNNIQSIDHLTHDGGIVVSSANVSKGDIDNDHLTSTGTFSDRLTLQFTNATDRTIFNCEGTGIKAGEHVIESYYLSEGDLKCDASIGGTNDLGKRASTIIEGADVFSVRLGVQNKQNNTAYVNTDDYLSLPKKPIITSIKMELLLRGKQPVVGATRKTFNIMDETVTVDKTKNITGNFIRNTYESTTLLRNARGHFD